MRTYLYFLLIGILSFIGYICTIYLFNLAWHWITLNEVLFWFGILILLNIVIIVALRKKGEKISAYMVILSFFTFFSAVGFSILASFFWAAYYEHYHGMADVIHKVECSECSRVVEINESIIRKYPYLKEILEKLKEENYASFRPNELNEIKELINYGDCLKYNESCYMLIFITS